MPVRSASARTASGNARRSTRIRKPNASPPAPQPKQWKMPRLGFTVNDGVRSVWNGQRPFQLSPARFRLTNWPTRSTMSARARISSSNVWVNPAISPLDAGQNRPLARTARGPPSRMRRAIPSHGASALSQHDDGGAGSALCGCAWAVLEDEGMRAQQLLDGAPQRARPASMNDPHRRQPGEKRVVEVFLEDIARLVRGSPDQVKLGRDIVLVGVMDAATTSRRRPARRGAGLRPPVASAGAGRGRVAARCARLIGDAHGLTRHLHGQRAGADHGRGALDREDLAPQAEMNDVHAVAGRGGNIRAGSGGRFGTHALGALRGVAHALGALRELGPCPLALSQALPLLVDRAPHVADELTRVCLGPRDGLARLSPRGLELALRAAQEPRGLDLAGLEQRGALGFAPVAIIESGQQLLELARAGGAIAVGSRDQIGGQAQGGADRRGLPWPRPAVTGPERGGGRLR